MIHHCQNCGELTFISCLQFNYKDLGSLQYWPSLAIYQMRLKNWQIMEKTINSLGENEFWKPYNQIMAPKYFINTVQKITGTSNYISQRIYRFIQVTMLTGVFDVIWLSSGDNFITETYLRKKEKNNEKLYYI